MASNDFPCSRCEGRGKIGAYSHVLGGVCLKCHGTGRQSCKPRHSAVKYAVFLLNRETGMAERIYNFAARSSAEALRELNRKYFNASSSFRDMYTTEGAVIVRADEIDCRDMEE